MGGQAAPCNSACEAIAIFAAKDKPDGLTSLSYVSRAYTDSRTFQDSVPKTSTVISKKRSKSASHYEVARAENSPLLRNSMATTGSNQSQQSKAKT